jgi:hypothetical protein
MQIGTLLKQITLAGGLIFAGSLLLASCSSGGTQRPSGPHGPEGLSLDYCRVVDTAGEMHVQWSANHRTTGEIRYGKSTYSALARFAQNTAEHDHLLIGLDWSTSYLYELRVTDSLSNTVVCSGNFRTPDKAFPQPGILGLAITDIGETAAVVSWRTDEPATTMLFYGTMNPLDSIVDPQLLISHEVTLSDLTEETAYLLRAEAVDSTGLRGVGRDTSFVTAARLRVRADGATIELGDTARINVYLENSTDLAALQYKFEFDVGSIEVVDLLEGPFFTGNDGFAFFRGIRNARGEVTNHMTWTIEYAGDTRVGTAADGDGVIAQLLIRGIQPGNAHAVLAADSTFGLDMYAERRTCNLTAGTIMVEP